MKTKNLIPCLLGSLLLVAVACGDDDDKNNKPPVINTGGSNAGTGNRAGSGGSKSDGGSESNGGAGNNTSEGGDPPVNNGGEAGQGPVEVPCDLPELGEDGCFNCPDNGNVEQFLNRCTEGDIVEFSNAARLPLLEDDGSLPDLPN